MIEFKGESNLLMVVFGAYRHNKWKEITWRGMHTLCYCRAVRKDIALIGDASRMSLARRAALAKLPCDSCIGRSLNLCRPLDDIGLMQLLALGGPRHWNRRELLFRAGDTQGPFFKITHGIVAVSCTLDDGRRQIVALRAPGDCVGYLEREGCYEFEGEALTEVEACAFDRREFDVFVARHPDVAAALAEALSSALKQAAQNMVVMGQLKSTERVANFLAELSALYNERHMSTRPMTLHMTRTEIADYLGLRIETVSRSFGKLKRRNFIALAGGDAVVILDHERLAELGKLRT